MMLFAMCASTIPTAASANNPQSTFASRYTASSPPRPAATSVIGRTPPRVIHNHFDTGSSVPLGGLVVARTYSHFLGRLSRCPMTASVIGRGYPCPVARAEATTAHRGGGRRAAVPSRAMTPEDALRAWGAYDLD